MVIKRSLRTGANSQATSKIPMAPPTPYSIPAQPLL